MLHEPPITTTELMLHLFQGYGPAVKAEDEDRHMNVNVTSSGQGTKTVILQIPKVSDIFWKKISISIHFKDLLVTCKQ